eukprot:scaffold48_cov311-Pinguiococcus_pyrenoidosus.AAC.324
MLPLHPGPGSFHLAVRCASKSNAVVGASMRPYFDRSLLRSVAILLPAAEGSPRRILLPSQSDGGPAALALRE